MQKIILTSEKFEGQVVVAYNDPGMGEEAWGAIVSVDFREAKLAEHRVAYILRQLSLFPRLTGDWTMGTESIAVVIANAQVDFEEDFWKPYNRKINKERVLKVWNKMKETDRQLAAVGVLKYNRYIAKCSKRPKKDPEGYLRDRMWLTDWDNEEAF